MSNSDTANVSRAGSTQLGQLWIGDSGCSCSTTNDLSGMFDVETIDKNVIGFGGQSVHATKKGKNENFCKAKRWENDRKTPPIGQILPKWK